MNGPHDAIVAVTYWCNARCTMCNIWKERPTNEVAPDFYRKLPKSIRTVNVTGGEPFTRKDLAAIVRTIDEACDRPRIVISSNGFLPKVVRATVSEILEFKPDVGVRISFDGIAETHDEIRGKRGVFDDCLESVRVLKDIGVRDLGIAFTVQDRNVADTRRVYELSKSLDVQYTMSFVHSSEIYFKNGPADVAPAAAIRDRERLADEMDYVARHELESWQPKRWFRAYFESGLFDHAVGEPRPMTCTAAHDFFFLDPQGMLYPCNILNRPIGSLREHSFEELWSSATREAEAAYARECPIACWMVCTAAPTMKRRPIRPALWVVTHKMRSHLGKRVIA
jgi:MoaA/NifB/PqqE/SkfB family radical SAM enzyme